MSDRTRLTLHPPKGAADAAPRRSKVDRDRLAADIYVSLLGKFVARGMSANEARNMAGEAFSYADAFLGVAEEK